MAPKSIDPKSQKKLAADEMKTPYGPVDVAGVRRDASGNLKMPPKFPTELPEKFDLSSALGPAISPLVAQLQQALGLPAGGGPAGPGQAASGAAPGLPAYLAAITGGAAQMGVPQAGQSLAQTLQSGLGAMGQAEAGMGPALQAWSQNLGQSSLLDDLLQAARYQAIYRQAGYGQPPAQGQPGYNPAISQLYATVVGGGNALSGGGAALPASITQPGKTGTSVINPGSSPFNGG